MRLKFISKRPSGDFSCCACDAKHAGRRNAKIRYSFFIAVKYVFFVLTNLRCKYSANF